MVLGFSYLQVAAVVAVALVLIKVVPWAKVKAIFEKSSDPSTTPPSVVVDPIITPSGVSPQVAAQLKKYNYQQLAAALKVLYDHIDTVGTESELATLDSLAKLILRDSDEE